MKVAGVIAEFNPFHNGHAYFLRRVRQLTSADFIIVVMSGDFTQRGGIATAGKRLRTQAALMNGADIVAELPMQFATASAELFAFGGTASLELTGVVDKICFGTEEEDIGLLKEMAGLIASETEEYKENLRIHLKEGMNYPEARLHALKETAAPAAGEISDAVLDDVLCKPNNILALEYIKALKKLGSRMEIVNIKRVSVDHDSANTYGVYSSAKNIRNTLKTTRSLDAVSVYLPENTLPLLREHYCIDFPLHDDDMSAMMKYRLLMEDEGSLMRYADMNADLARRIINKRNDFISVTQFTELLKTRNLTYTRIARALLHMFLSVTREDMKQFVNCLEKGASQKGAAEGYIRILGFKKDAAPLMERLRQASHVPVISKVSDHKRLLRGFSRKMFEDTLRASDIYNSIVKDIYDTDLTSDIKRITEGINDCIIF